MFLRIQVAVAILVAPSAVALATDSSVTAPLDAPFQRASYKTVVQPPAPGKIRCPKILSGTNEGW